MTRQGARIRGLEALSAELPITENVVRGIQVIMAAARGLQKELGLLLPMGFFWEKTAEARL